jgi:hypothetical protein
MLDQEAAVADQVDALDPRVDVLLDERDEERLDPLFHTPLVAVDEQLSLRQRERRVEDRRSEPRAGAFEELGAARRLGV